MRVTVYLQVFVIESLPGGFHPTDNWFVSLVISGFPAHRIVSDHNDPTIVFAGFYSAYSGPPQALKPFLGRIGCVLVIWTWEATSYEELEHIPYDFLLGPSVPPYRHHGAYMPYSWLQFNVNRRYKPTRLIQPAAFNVTAVFAAKTRFCAFVHINCNDRNGRTRSFRNSFFQELSKYKFVHAPGLCMHNSDDDDFKVYALDDPDAHEQYENTIEHDRKYKFVISMENVAMPGYQTEKLPIALLAGRHCLQKPRKLP